MNLCRTCCWRACSEPVYTSHMISGCWSLFVVIVIKPLVFSLPLQTVTYWQRLSRPTTFPTCSCSSCILLTLISLQVFGGENCCRLLLSLVRGLGEVRGSLETVSLPVRKRNHIRRKSVRACLWNQEISLIRLLEMSNWSVRGASVSWAERRILSCRISRGHSQGAKAHSADRLS